MRSQYASAPTPPPPTVTIGTGSITTAKAGNYTAWLQLRNRAGVTTFSPSVSFAIAAGQNATLCIPAAVRQPACDIHEVLLLLSKTADPTQAAVVATYPGYELDGVTLRSLPYDFVLSRDEHLELGKMLVNRAQLPQNMDLIHGMRRYVESDGQVLAYDGYRNVWNRASPPSFSTYVSSSQGTGGCDRDIAVIDPSEVITPDYDASGDLSQPVKFWIVNDTDQTTPQAIPEGTRVRLAVDINGADYSAKFVGLMVLTVLGHANLATGALDTSDIPQVGVQSVYQGDRQTDLILSKPLPPGWAYMFQVQVAFQFFQLNNEVMQGATIRFYPRFSTVNASYDEGGELLGDYILAKEKLRRIVPNGAGLNAIALPGSGRVGSYTFREVGAQIVVGFAPNAPNQNCVITNNGVCFVTNIIPVGAHLRCLVGTVDGVGRATEWGQAIALSPSTVLQVTVSHPTSIRSDYPDAIAGLSDGRPNITRIVVYVKSETSGAISSFPVLYTLGEPSSEFLVGAIAGTNVGNNLPAVDDDFGLYAPSSESFTTTPADGTGVFESGEYRVAIAYSYENTITSISHSVTHGCIYEAGATLAQVFDSTKYWAPGVQSLSDLRSVPLSLVYPYQSRYVADQNNPYRYDPNTTADDDGVSIIKLDAVPVSAPGRFLLDDSAAWYSGSGTPSPTLGTVGDYYVDSDAESTTAGKIWKKQTPVAWNDSGSIRGVQGIPGLSDRGKWSDSATYIKGDIVSHNNSAWIVQKENVGIDPVLDTGINWLPLVRGVRSRGEYEAPTTYYLNDLVAFNNSSYLYINETPVSNTDIRNTGFWLPLALSTVYTPRGEYNDTTLYSKFDVVSFDGSTYLYINNAPSIGNTPPNATYWQTHSSRGPTGSVTSSIGGIILDNGVAPATASNQIALFSSDTARASVKFPGNGISSGIALLDIPQIYTKTQAIAETQLDNAINIETDASASNKFRVILNQNGVLVNPTNLMSATYLWHIYQNTVGGYVLSFGNAFKFPGGNPPTVSTAANAHDLLTCDSDGTNLYCSLLKDLR